MTGLASPTILDHSSVFFLTKSAGSLHSLSLISITFILKFWLKAKPFLFLSLSLQLVSIKTKVQICCVSMEQC